LTRPTERALVTGAGGQIGSELTPALRARFGSKAIVATDVRAPSDLSRWGDGPFEVLDVRDRDRLDALVAQHGVDTVFHLAAILSATGEENPQAAWDVNVCGLVNVLEVARARKLRRVFCPSSIAVFGPGTPRNLAPQETILQPTTIYGLTKLTGELLGAYYVRRYGLDVRGVRYPGIISSVTPPGGGTTDYAVEVFYEALRTRRYTCFVRAETVLPMMYMPDCIKATLDLMDADCSCLRYPTSYNIAGLSFSAAELTAEIAKHIPSFACEYRPDFRQAIADSWPVAVDDMPAREDWGWAPNYDLAAMVEDMLSRLGSRISADNRPTSRP